MRTNDSLGQQFSEAITDHGFKVDPELDYSNPMHRGPDENIWHLTDTEDVPVNKLVATQHTIEKSGLEKYRNGGESDTLPRVAVEGGTPYIIDGHHRAVVAKEKGQKTIRAHVWHDHRDRVARAEL